MSLADTIELPTQLTDEERRPLRNTLLEPPHRYARVGSTITHGLQAEPAVLHFAGIASGERIDMTVRLVNVSGDPLRMHIHPPATPFFSMRCNKKGRVMPGTAQDVTISCRPTDLRYYSDCIRVHCDRGNLIVPIHAYPGVSAINIPKRVDFGFVPLDSSASATLPLRSWVPMEFEYKIDLLQDSPGARLAARPLEEPLRLRLRADASRGDHHLFRRWGFVSTVGDIDNSRLKLVCGQVDERNGLIGHYNR